MSRADIVIVGSGFGGAVMAARLAAHFVGRGESIGPDGARRIVILEKGADFTGSFDSDAPARELNAQGNTFRQTLAPDYLAMVGELFTDPQGAFKPGKPSLNVVAGIGVGGGSNLYCGVSLRAPAASFEQTRAGRRLWPTRYTRAYLDPFYERAEQMLRVVQLAWTDADAPHWQLTTKRDLVFAEGAQRIGATAVPLRLADDNDANEGWWTQGQRFEGRQNLTKNYLREAARLGVEVWTSCTVDEIEPDGDAGYVVRGVDRRSGEASLELECKMLLLGAGAVGTTGLLLRSETKFADARALDAAFDANGTRTLGKHLSSNGDYGVTGVVGPAYARDVQGQRGKPMSSFSPSFWAEHRFIIIPFHTPPLYFAQHQVSSLLPPDNAQATGRASTEVKRDADGKPLRDWGRSFKERVQAFDRRFLTMGCLAWDECEGEVRLDATGRPTVAWPQTHPNTEQRWSRAFTAMRDIYAALGGEMMLDSYRRDGTVNTAHPLGGCRMAEDAAFGIVDENGECFANPNLFVVDGGNVPSALGVNPSLTIAAVAESIASRLIFGIGTRSLVDRVA